MARRLSRYGSALPSRRRSGRFVALVLAVAAVHGCVTRDIADRMDAFASAARMPARLEVAYVRTLELAAPPVLVPARPTPPSPRPRAARARPAKPASAPEPTALAEAPKPDVPPDVDAAASEPWPSVAEAVAPAASAAASAPPIEAASAPAAPASAAFAAAASEPAIRPADGTVPSEPFDWPASTRVTFILTGNYRGEVSGNAQVEWVRVGTHYQVHLDLVVGPEFAPIIRRRMTSDGELTPDGLTPSRYDEDTQVVFRERRRVSVLFEPDAVVLANGQRRERWRGVQDTASQFVQLTWLFTTQPELLRVGGTVEMPLALARSVDRWIYDVLDEVELQTPFGPLSTFHLKPRRATQKPGDLSAEIWFAPQLRYLPVRIRIEQDPQTFLDLIIARKPDLASR